MPAERLGAAPRHPAAYHEPVPRHITAVGPLDGPGPAPVLDPRRPLTIRHLAGGPTLAVVSIAWLAAIGDGGQVRLARQHLSAAEQRHRQSLHVRKRRVEWLAGRLAVKHGVRSYQRTRLGAAATPAPEVCVRRIDNGPRAGKPFVDLPVEIAVTHSGDFAVAACGPHPVGIDLEPVREVTPYLAGLLAVPGAGIGDKARKRLLGMPHALRWACREAVLKYYGVGLRLGGPRQVELTGWHPDGRFTWRAAPELREYCAASAQFPPLECFASVTDGYALAVVWR